MDLKEHLLQNRRHIQKKKISLKEYIANMKKEFGNLQMKVFCFNPFLVNTLVFYDETKEAVIVDPGNHVKKENEALREFIEKNELTVKYILITHAHIDHVLGCAYCKETFSAPIVMHTVASELYKDVHESAELFSFYINDFPAPSKLLEEKDKIKFGNQTWEVIYTPGHMDGSISFYDSKNRFVVTGDIIFSQSIGRTDLPTGSFSLLIETVKAKLFTLDEDVVVISGHGEMTTIGQQKRENPFF